MKKTIYYILMLVLLCAMVGCDGGSEDGEDKEQTPSVEATDMPTPENTPTAEVTSGAVQGTEAPMPTGSGMEDDNLLQPTETVPTKGVDNNPTQAPTAAPTQEPTANPTQTPVATPTTGVIELPFAPF